MSAVIRRAAASLAVLLAVSPALAGPSLRAAALVSSDRVTVGDLIEGADPALADVALFRAPDLGLTGAVPAQDVAEAARRAGVVDLDLGASANVSVTRLSRAFTADDIERAVAERAAAEFGAQAEAMRVTLDEAATLHLDPSAAPQPVIARFAADPRSGRFEASFAAGRDGAVRRVTGSAIETVEVAVAARSLARGDVLREADVVLERRPRVQSGEGVDLAAAKGMALRRPMREGQALRAADLIRPQHVERGGFVTLVYGLGGMSLSLKAKALQSGAQGDLVAVQNIQSKRTVTGVVTGPSEVTVSAAPTAVARR
ncbi:flagellar basal body P-ring formation chaperone FlgA [Methylopila jiangsuensis]|uniref:flagellar basal body P-ring formation chaperone FlgA n=1 Tax=Methylopila jiangsuensis TaxID=586230 RepID=UPI00286C4B3D|nr:flagellar basal body P-ring formation chaperone FlgA [Methylopila jiangsuensis]